MIINKNKKRLINMNYGIREGLEFFVFDHEGTFVAHVDYSKKSYIDNNLLIVDTDLIGSDMLGFANKVEQNDKNDFESFFDRQQTTYVINENSNKDCKLIAKSTYRGDKDLKYRTVYYEIPKAKLINKPEFHHNGYEDPAKFHYLFEIEPYNELGDLYKLHIEENEHSIGNNLNIQVNTYIDNQWNKVGRDEIAKLVTKHLQKVADSSLIH